MLRLIGEEGMILELGLLLLVTQPPEEGEKEDGDIEVEGTREARTN
jgi:hypothetical protein